MMEQTITKSIQERHVPKSVELRNGIDTPSLDRDEEIAATQRISELETGLWEVVFDNPSKLRFAVDRILEEMEGKRRYERCEELATHLKKVCNLAKKAKTKKGETAFAEAAEKAIELLQDVDLDREFALAAADELISRGTKNRASGEQTLTQHAQRIAGICRTIEAAKHQFIQSNQGLVTLIAQRYKGKQVPLSDLIQEGNIGLIKAVNRFDYRKGYQFSTYASWWIRSAIGRAIDYKETMIRIPGSAIRNRSQLRKAINSIRQQTGRTPTEKEIAEETGMGSLRLERTRKHVVTRVFSLDEELSDSNHLRFIDVLVDENNLNPFEETMLTTLTNELSELLEELSPLERSILRSRYGLDDFEPLTLRELGEQYGLSRERIRQIQNRALNKLRDKMEQDAA